jgi:hypothetical protein
MDTFCREFATECSSHHHKTYRHHSRPVVYRHSLSPDANVPSSQRYSHLGLPRTSNGFSEGNKGHTTDTGGRTQIVTMPNISNSRIKHMNIAKSGIINTSTTSSWTRTTDHKRLWSFIKSTDAWIRVEWHP